MLQLAHTGDLEPATLTAIRELLDEAYLGSWDEQDWDHTLGGMHALIWDSDELVGHGSLVQRRLLHGGRALRTGYVEGVGVRSSHRRRGHANALMAGLERIARGAYELAALSSSTMARSLYQSRGWRQWQGMTFAITPTGIERTEDEDGGVYVLPLGVPLDFSGDLICDWRDGDVW